MTEQPNTPGDLSEAEYRAAYDLVADACDGDMGPGGEALDALIAAGWRPPREVNVPLEGT